MRNSHEGLRPPRDQEVCSTGPASPRACVLPHRHACATSNKLLFVKHNPKHSLTETIQDALAVERAAWAAVRDKQPGKPGHDPRLCAAWLDAAERLAMVPLPERRFSEERTGESPRS